MNKFKIKYLVSFLLLSISLAPLSALSAKVTYVKGKVEVNRRNTWVQLKTGDSVSEKETISTGYQSEIRLDLNGSILSVPAMSRVTIETLKSSSDSKEVSVYVDTGAARSKVKHTDNQKVDYTTRTAVAVASVRGTDYTQIANGDVSCDEGTVWVCSSGDYDATNKVNPGSTVIKQGQETGIGQNGKTYGVKDSVNQKREDMSKGVKTASEQESDSSEDFDKDYEKGGILIIDVYCTIEA